LTNEWVPKPKNFHFRAQSISGASKFEKRGTLQIFLATPLPPTTDSAKYHMLQVFWQVRWCKRGCDTKMVLLSLQNSVQYEMYPCKGEICTNSEITEDIFEEQQPF